MHAEVDFGERLYFQGTVIDNQGLGVSQSIVLLLAYFEDGFEKPLGYSFTDQEGRYLISITKPSLCPGLLEYKVRASKLDLPSSVLPPDVTPKEFCLALAAGTDQFPVIHCAACVSAAAPDKVSQEINIAIGAKDHVIELIDLTTAGEIENHWQPAEVANNAEEPNKKAATLIKKSELLVDRMLLMLLLSLLGFAVLQNNVIGCRFRS